MSDVMTYQLGMDGFIWWIGVVEDTKDTMSIGRAKVRIFGWHNADPSVISTNDLPWAVPIAPLTNATGIPTYKNGDWVMGFFLDGKFGQQPMIFGVLPAIPHGGFWKKLASTALNVAIASQTGGLNILGSNIAGSLAGNLVKNVGFMDLRNAAELMLGPAAPVSRSLANLGSLKLDVGAKLPLPGAISGPKSLTGAVRNAFKPVLDFKKTTQAISQALATTVKQFDPTKVVGKIATGRVSLGVDGIPTASSFLEFSTLKPGEKIPADFNKVIEQRKQQLQALTSRVSTVFTGTSLSGVSLKENFSKKPYPREEDLGLPTIPRLAQGGAEALKDSILKDKRKFAVVGVQIGAGKPSFWSRLLTKAAVKAVPTLNPVVNHIFKDRKNGSTWSEPTSPYAAQFPYNKVQQTESGHVFELDDTPGAERVHIFHRSGSFVEFHPNGTVVYKNMKDGYDLTMGSKHVKVNGKCHVAVDGGATFYVKGNVDIQSDGDINVNAKKDFNVYARNINLRAKHTFKADGTGIDLRYIKMPQSLLPVAMGGGFAPRISIAAIKADFPKSNIDRVLRNMASNPLDPKAANTALVLKGETVSEPVENPLSNPGIYTLKTTAAKVYRNRFFDTPEETENLELYAAHVGLQKELGDYTDDPRQLGGKLVAPAATGTKNTAVVDYLNFDDFKGTFEYANTFQLGTTSFVLSDLVDTAMYPTLAPPIKTAVPLLAPEETTVEVTAPDLGSDDDDDSSSGAVPNRLSAVQEVNRLHPGLIVSDPGGFVDEVAHYLNKLDGYSGDQIRWGRKARQSDGGNPNKDALAFRLDLADNSKKWLIDIIVDSESPDAHPGWQAYGGPNEGNGYWTAPKSGPR